MCELDFGLVGKTTFQDFLETFPGPSLHKSEWKYTEKQQQNKRIPW